MSLYFVICIYFVYILYIFCDVHGCDTYLKAAKNFKSRKAGKLKNFNFVEEILNDYPVTFQISAEKQHLCRKAIKRSFVLDVKELFEEFFCTNF